MRVANSSRQLRDSWTSCLLVNIRMVTSGSLQPHIAGSREQITVRIPQHNWTSLVFALQTIDDANHQSNLSNIVAATFEVPKLVGQPVAIVDVSVKPTDSETPATGTPENGTPVNPPQTVALGAVVGSVFGGCGVLLMFGIVVFYFLKPKTKVADPENVQHLRKHGRL